MSEEPKSIDLKLMEEFDVSVPFTVEIFYESDDDKSPANEIENNKNKQAKDLNLDEILNGIIGDITKAAEKSNQIEQASSKKRRQSSESSPAKKTKTNKNEIQVAKILNLEHREANIQNEQAVSREKTQQSSNNEQTITLYASQSLNDIRSQANDRQCAPYNQHKIQSQQIMINNTGQDTINNTKLSSVNNSNSANNRQPLENTNNEQNFNSCINSQNSINNNIHPLVSLAQMVVSQNQSDLHTKASECVGTLLMTVSNHLVCVMKAWTEYMEVYKSSNRPLITIAYKQYRETKYHFFQLSFTSVSNILLAKENDHVFINKFTEYTIEVARSRNIYFTYQNLKAMLDELFAWVKSYRYPLLNQLLQPLPQPHAPDDNNNGSKTHQGCQGCQCENINNGGNVSNGIELPRRDLIVNMNSSAVGTTQPVQNLNSPIQSFTYYEIPIQQQIPQPQSRNFPTFVEQFQAFTRQNNPSLSRGVTLEPKNNKVKNKRGPKPKTIHAVPQEVQVRTFLPPPYEDHHLISSVQYNSFQPENEACEVNKSLSRDSGIASPNSPANDINYFPPAMTPLITHVTSLNPSATQIKDGVCLVCGTATKQMCLGCYKTYYCSSKCQVTDWTRHVRICK